MIPHFPFQHYRFHLAPKKPLRMPAYDKGHMIRGGFGSTFRRIVCDRIGNRHEAISAGIRQEAIGNSKKTIPKAYVEIRAGVRGGAPMIAGTGIKVLDVAVRYEVMGMSPEEIMIAFPRLDLSRIHAALAYYYAHKADLDRHWKTSLKKVVRQRAGQSSILE